MKLITKEIEKKFEKHPIYSQDGKGDAAEVIVKFFNPCGSQSWYIIEASKTEDGDYEMFGLCTGSYFDELGYVMLSELESIRLPFGLGIERDMYWKGTIGDARKEAR